MPNALAIAAPVEREEPVTMATLPDGGNIDGIGNPESVGRL